jgi:hypothetical protein
MKREKLNRHIFLMLIACVAVFGVIPAVHAQPPPAQSPDGLVLIPDTKMSAVYIRPGADFSGYTKVAIMECHVAFRKDWKRDINRATTRRISDDDMMRIKSELGKRLEIVFADELTAKGTAVTNQAAADVLILRPVILNLDVAEPDTMEPGVVRRFSSSAGEMTLYLEIFDGVTGDLLARVIDRRADDNFGRLQIRNSVTNRSDADRILRLWASALANYLQEVRKTRQVTARSPDAGN